MRELNRAQKIEQSITYKYRKQLWAPFLTAVNQYALIAPGDHIAVCISGGKDSMLMAKLMQMLQKYSKIPFSLTYLVMDPGYSPANRQKIIANAETLDLPIQIFDTQIFAVAEQEMKKPCYLCARMRRGHLYHEAQVLGCNKIALGHHLNDAIETVLMSMFWSSKLETIVPKCHSENFAGMELIRPMYGIKEDDIKAWCQYNDLSFIQCACRFTENAVKEDEHLSKRMEAKLLIRELKKDNPEIEENMFRALHRVQLNTFPGYQNGKEMHSILDDYDKETDKKQQ
ncbi:MAG: tRNA 2-thiocytidine biosynthesis protein TtcA [Solobacterium sp.]|jgi:tRNA(Ile)-lysidine synthase TilS/MesJ|nr:tRNA 2-thiocytidine biosynthesis protein TtcA [Solobacterium sp.]MCH4206142.1 tRNA 2-thiocytidine biosynthesis protein TtcA [Solobacterium sp.]MCH4227608.1 tRNA 2-thiocytidine biosynthesis protein TtcA [Solobacterium sp.]MCH4282592.1 tRNA 2-thiocytidine biosynthesis protein TtcA [Solobacterium sp.]